MGGQKCPNCKKGILIRKGKRTKVRCTVCGYWKFHSPNASSRGSLIGALSTPKPEIHPDPKVEDELVEGLKIPEGRKRRKEKEVEMEEEPKIPYPLNSQEYKMEKEAREQYLHDMRKSASIQKLLKKIGKNKYSGLIGKEIELEGAMWKVGEEENEQSSEQESNDL